MSRKFISANNYAKKLFLLNYQMEKNITRNEAARYQAVSLIEKPNAIQSDSNLKNIHNSLINIRSIYVTRTVIIIV